MRALVMGGNRYIGRHLVFELARQGHDVTVMNSHEAPMPAGAAAHPRRSSTPGRRSRPRWARTATTSTWCSTTRRTRSMTSSRWSTSFVAGSASSCSPARSRSTSAASCSRSPSLTRRTRPTTPTPARPTASARSGASSTCSTSPSCNATSLRVTHTIGPHSPLVTREPIFFRRLELGRPILIPAEGFPFVHLVHVQDVARLMVSLIGNERGASADLQRRRRRLHERPRLHRADGAGGRCAARSRARPASTWLAALVMRSCTGARRSSAGRRSPSTRRSRTSTGRRATASKPRTQTRTRGSTAEGRDTFEYDFSADDALLAELAAAR